MAFAWNPLGAFWVLAGASAWALAGFAYFSAPSRAVNRRLALLFAFEGAALLGAGTEYLATSLAEAWGGQAVAVTFVTLVPWCYLAFVAEALDTPLVAPLRRPAVLGSALLLSLGAEAAWFASPAAFIRGLVPAGYAAYDAEVGPGFVAVIAALALVALFALAASVSALLRAERGSLARVRARAFVAAFGTRDAFLATTILATLLFSTRFAPDDLLFQVATVYGYPLASVVTVLLVGYGILHSQLFDLDVKVKLTIRRGTLASVFLGVFFIAAQLAQNLLSQGLGLVAGGVAAGALLFALHPLQRVAERVADRAMPGVSASPEYLAFRKLEVYRVAVESALESGGVDARERALLDRLRGKLGIQPRDAAALERELMARAAPARR